jgi:hypothetical protein
MWRMENRFSVNLSAPLMPGSPRLDANIITKITTIYREDFFKKFSKTKTPEHRGFCLDKYTAISSYEFYIKLN